MTYAVVTISWMLKHGLHPTQEMRKSADGNYVIVHGEFLEPFDDGEQFTRYYHNDLSLLNYFNQKHGVHQRKLQ